jgi:succinate dehydrogenase / fumarate reductase, cytochrome b subunit
MSVASPTASQADFWRARLFSLFGVLPLGAWVLWHFATQSYSQAGSVAYDAKMQDIYAHPLYWPAVILLFYAPFLFHAVWGVFIARKSSWQVTRFNTLQNYKYFFQRLSGIGLLLFLPAHLFKARIEPWLSQSGEAHKFIHLNHALNTQPAAVLTMAVYTAGIVGVAFHLANGLWGFSITWGLVQSRHAQRRLEAATIALFFVFVAFGFYALTGFFTDKA